MSSSRYSGQNYKPIMFPKDLIDGIKNFKDLTYRGSFIYFP
jgi:hypothetical protein